MDSNRRTYRAVVIGNAIKRSKKNQTPSVKIAVQTKYDLAAPDCEEVNTLYGDLWLTAATLERTRRTLLEVFEVDFRNVADLNEPILTGKECNIVVEDEEYEGEVSPKIIFFNRPGGLKPLDVSDLEEVVNTVQPLLDQQVKIDASKDFDIPAAQAGAAAQDDDMPF